MDREALAWALLFSVPVGVGITGYADHVFRRGILDPISILVGIGTTIVIFAIVAYGFAGGSPDEEHEERRAG